ncbi:hypothetical protein BASA62_003044 [Batrachochytrium salamandrivorans]|nr:hypothetical protein BASA62_003044 [Batrachochytrium salamandrivorans]
MISISPVHKRPVEIIPLRKCDDDDDDDGIDTIQTAYIFPKPIINLGPTSDRRGSSTQPTSTPVGTLVGAMRTPIWPSPINYPLLNACTTPKIVPIDMAVLETISFLELEPPAITTHLPKRIYHAVSSWVSDRLKRSLDDPDSQTIESFAMIQSRSTPTMAFTTPPNVPNFPSIEQRARNRRVLKLRSNVGVGSKKNQSVRRRLPLLPSLIGKSLAFFRSADSTLATTTGSRTPVDSAAVDCNRAITAEPTKDRETTEITETEETEETEEIEEITETEQVTPASTSRSPWSILRRFHVSTRPAAEVDTTLASTMMDEVYPRPYNTAISDRERRRLARLDNSLGGDYSSIDREWLSMMSEPTYFIHKRSLEPHPRTVTFDQNVTTMPFFKANGVSHLLEIHPGDETDIEDGRRDLEYDRAHGVSSESHASLEVKQLPAGAVDIHSVAAFSDQPIHLEESARLYSDEQQAEAVVGPVLDEPPRRMSVAERVRRYEAKTVSSMTSVGYCIPTHIQTCRSVPTAAVIPTNIPLVYPTVVTSAASSSSTAATTTNELPSTGTLKASAGQLPTVETIDRLIKELLTSDISKSQLIFKFRFRLGRRSTISVSKTELDEPRASINTVDSGYHSNGSSISSAFDATKF